MVVVRALWNSSCNSHLGPLVVADPVAQWWIPEGGTSEHMLLRVLGSHPVAVVGTWDQ